jgi:hypothetical protein
VSKIYSHFVRNVIAGNGVNKFTFYHINENISTLTGFILIALGSTSDIILTKRVRTVAKISVMVSEKSGTISYLLLLLSRKVAGLSLDEVNEFFSIYLILPRSRKPIIWP